VSSHNLLTDLNTDWTGGVAKLFLSSPPRSWSQKLSCVTSSTAYWCLLCAQTDTKGQAAFLSLPKPKLSYFYGTII